MGNPRINNSQRCQVKPPEANSKELGICNQPKSAGVLCPTWISRIVDLNWWSISCPLPESLRIGMDYPDRVLGLWKLPHLNQSTKAINKDLRSHNFEYSDRIMDSFSIKPPDCVHNREHTLGDCK
jgi:hypothetical protein